MVVSIFYVIMRIDALLGSSQPTFFANKKLFCMELYQGGSDENYLYSVQ